MKGKLVRNNQKILSEGKKGKLRGVFHTFHTHLFHVIILTLSLLRSLFRGKIKESFRL